MPQPSSHILFVTGGTEGHLNPLLAVVEACQLEAKRRGILLRTSYVGTAHDLQLPSLQAFRYPLEKYTIHAGKLHRFVTLRQVKELAHLSLGLIEAQFLLQKLRPDAIFAKGSAVSVPIILAAARLRIPVFSHETDVRSGLTNQLASRFAKLVFTAFPVANYLNIPVEKLRYVGQPVRPEFFQPALGPLVVQSKEVSLRTAIITVIGGSQGARRLNQLVAEQWTEYLAVSQLIHLTGPQEYSQYEELALQLPAELRTRLYLAPYLGNGLAFAFQHSSVVVSRAGGTIAELAASKVPSVLVPLSTAAQDHQQANAEVLASDGAALLFAESGSARQLREAVIRLLQNPTQRQQLSQRISTFAHPDAAGNIAVTLLDSLS